MPGQIDWMHPSTAAKVVGVITDIAQSAVEAAITYRMAVVTDINVADIVVEFSDEPGNPVTVPLGSIQPATVGQNVEILVRNGTDFVLNRVFGATVVVGEAPVSPVAAPSGLALATANRAVTATWATLADATSYDVQRAKDAAFTNTASITNVIGNQLVNTNLTVGDGWYYRVRGVNSAGTSPWSSSQSIVVTGDYIAPSAPTQVLGVFTTNIELGLIVNWTPQDSADHYELQYSKSSTFASGVTTVTVQGSNFQHSGLVAGDVWYYRVRAINAAGTGTYSATANGTVATNIPTAGAAPGQVTGLALTGANRSITAVWTPLTAALYYQVDRATDAAFTVNLVTTQVQGSTITFTGLTAGTTYYFRVRAVNNAGTGANSTSANLAAASTDVPVVTAPGQVTGLAVAVGELSLTASWTPIDTADHYDLQWSQDNTFATGTTTQVVQGSSFTRSGLTAGQTWYYRVRAVNTGGNGTYSSTASGVVATNIPAPAGAPVQVTGLALSSAERAISVVWNPQAVATSYELYRAKDSGFTTGLVTQTLAGSTITINNLIAGETWYFKVRAINSAGTGTFSTTSSVVVQTDTPAPGSPAQITGLSLSSLPGTIFAKWTRDPVASSYQVDRSPDSTFVTGTITETTDGNTLDVGGLTPGSTWYFRVRGVNSTGNGTYSATSNISVVLPGSLTDGSAPANSPATTVRAGLGQLTAEWPAQTNSDLVTYEVHISTTSGFTPVAGTKLGETTGLFYITDHLPTGAALVAGTTYFMRVVAKDKDGSATPGAQGSGVPTTLSQTVSYSQVTGNGAVPATPAAPTVQSGIGYLYAAWTRPTSPDPLTYEVHVSTSSTFVPDANSLSLETSSLFAFIRLQGPGASSAPLVYGTTYYVKIIAKDVDGVSAPSPAGSGFTVQANTADIAVGAITAASGIIGNLAVGTAQIQDSAINSAKIQDLAVGTAEIADGAILTAKIGDAQITTAKIGLLQVTTAVIADSNITDAKIGSISAGKITVNGTMTATMTVSGVIKTSAGTGRVEMSSAGLYAYNSGGGTVFSLDNAGNAYFQGNIYAVNGTFTGSISSSATITGGSFVGASFSTASSGRRITMSSGATDTIQWYDSGGVAGGYIQGDSAGNGTSTITVGGTLWCSSPYFRNLSTGSASLSTTWSIGNGNTINGSLKVNNGYAVYGGGGVYEGQPEASYRVYSPVNTPPYPVTSVAGKTGAVTLGSGDVGATAASHTGSFHTNSTLDSYLGTGYSMALGEDGSSVRIYYSGTAGFRVTNGKQLNTDITGTVAKAFVIDHPSPAKKDTHFLQHVCIEGPTADVYYRGEAQLTFFQDPSWNDDPHFPNPTAGHGAATVFLPDYFEDLTEVEGRTVMVTPILGCDDKDCPFGFGDGDIADMVAPTLAVTRVRNGQFVVRTTAGFNHSCGSFFWEVKAIRKDVAPVVVEPSKDEYAVGGDGPYTYLIPA